MDATDRWIHIGPKKEMEKLNKSIGKLLMERIRLYGNRILQIYGPTEEKVSAAQLLERSISVALELRARGIRPGDVVSSALDNCLEVAYLLLAAFSVGAIHAPFNPDLHGDDLRHMVDMLEPRLVFCAPRAAPKIRAALPPGSEVVEMRPGTSEWESFLSHSGKAVADFQPYDTADVDGTACIMCSSGTTGAPKGVMLTHRNLFFIVDMVRKLDKETVDGKDCSLMVLPNFWISGLMANITNFGSGTPMVIYQKFTVEDILGGIEKYKITALVLSPPCIVAIAKHPNVEKYDVSSIKRLTFGGAITSPAMREVAERRMKKTFQQLYGQTECLACLFPSDKSYQKPLSVGTPTTNACAKVINIETGKPVGPHTEGEICVKSPTLFKGYYKCSKATAEAIDDEGWLHSGDVGYFDEDGYFYICDRYKELVKYKGIHIAPAEVEGVLVSHEAVKDAAVVGIEHDEDQEHPVGFVVLQEGHDVREEELLQMVRDQLPEYKQLHGGVYFVKEVPRTATGKIKRRDLRQVARALKTQNGQSLLKAE